MIGTIFRANQYRNRNTRWILNSSHCDLHIICLISLCSRINYLTIPINMGRGKGLTKEQIVVIREFHHLGKSVRFIAEWIKKSPTAVHNQITVLKQGCRTKKLGHPSTVTPYFKRAINRTIRLHRDERVTASSLVSKYQSPVGIRRVQQLLQESFQIAWARMRPAPRLTEEQRKNRFGWAERRLAENAVLSRRTIIKT